MGSTDPPAAEAPSSITLLTDAADRIRQTAKWLTVSLAGVAAVLVAGTQLSDIGALHLGSGRFWTAVAGGALAAVCTAGVLVVTIGVMTAPSVSLSDVERAERAHRDGSVAGTDFLDPLYLGKYRSVAEVRAAYLRQANAPDAERDEQEFRYAEGVAKHVVAVEYYRLMTRRWHRSGWLIVGLGLTAAAGIGMFAWAANPPARATASTVSPAVLARAVPVTVTLTAEGRAALGSAVGPACPLRTPLRALRLGSTAAGPDVLIDEPGCTPTRLIAVPAWASVAGR